MEDSVETSFNSQISMRLSKIFNIKDENIIFFISCFHNLISDDKSFFFNSQNNNVENISREYFEDSNIDKNYKYMVYCINFNATKREKYAYLLLNYENLKNLELTKLYIKNQKYFVFSDIKLEEKNLTRFLDKLNNKYSNNNFTKDNYYLKLEPELQLAIYKNFLDFTFKDDKSISEEYSKNLAGDFLYVIRKNKIYKFNFSTAVNLFLLSYQNKYILYFLEICTKIIYKKDNIDNINNFYKILNKYVNDKTEFTNIFKKEKEKAKLKYEDYIKNLNKFQLIYYSFYKINYLSENKEILFQARDILLDIINNRENIIETTKFIYENIYALVKLKDPNDFNNSFLKIKNTQNINNLNLDEFSQYYQKVVEYQKNNINDYFFDYSEIIKNLRSLYKYNIIYLEKIIIIFEFELRHQNNYELRKNIMINFYDAGMKLFQQGNLKNEKVLNFIKICDVYKSCKISDEYISNDKFVINYNNVLQNKKNVNILNGLDILLNGAPTQIPKKIKEMAIYKFFCQDMPREYIEIFSKKLTHIKYLGIFFEILPKNYYKSESIFALYNWIRINLGTFSRGECQNFKADINDFFELLIKLKEELAEDFLEILKEKLNIFCKELFLYFLNCNKCLNSRIRKYLILYFVSPKSLFDNYDISNLDNIIYFVENLTKEDDKIIKIFMDEMQNLTIQEDELFEQNNTKKYIFFQLLLKYKKKFITNQKGEYLSKTKLICEEIINKLKNYKYSIKFLKMILINDLEKEIFRKKLENILFFLANEIEPNNFIKEESIQILNNLSSKYNHTKTIINDLGEASFYLEIFFDKKLDKVELKNDIHKLINLLWVKTLGEIDTDKNIKQKIQNFQGIIKISKPIILKIKNSAIFRDIYESNKQKIEDQDYLLKETLKNYNSAIKLIKEKPEKIQNNKFINFFYKIGFQDQNSLEKEINWIIENENIKINEEEKSKLFSSLKILIKKQNIFNVIKAILIINEIYQKNLHPSLEEKNYFEELKSKLEELKKNISAMEIQSIINFINNKFKEITFDNKDKNYRNHVLPLFNSFIINQEAFLFFKDKKPEETKNLKEFLLDSDETELTLFEIDKFNRIIKFLNDDIMPLEHPFLLIQTFISGILDENKFMDYLIIVKDYNKYKNLFDKFLKGESGIFNKVRDIINSSYFVIKFAKEKNIYEINGCYKKILILEKKEEKSEFINSFEIDDLYERVFISINKNKKKDYIKEFIRIYKYMKNINNLINEIFLNYGYPEEIIVEFRIEVNVKCFLNLDNLKVYKEIELYNHFIQIKQKCDKILNKAILNSNEIRLFYGKQLYLINECLKNKEFDKIKDLISCATNGLIKEFNDDFIYVEDQGKDIYENMINNIKSYICEQFKFNKEQIKNIYLKNKIIISDNSILKAQEKELKGFYFKMTLIDEHDILNTFLVLTKSIPVNSNILFCNNETTTQEINTFVLKAIYCQIHSIFAIFIPQYINNSQKIFLIKLLRERKKKSQMIHSCLLVFFNSDDSEFHQSILKIGIQGLMNLDYILDSCSHILRKEINVEIISSSICGLGKSTFINNNINKGKKIYLPIGGDMTKEELTDRIVKSFEKIKIDKNKNYILHVDFTQTDNIEIIKDFLFKLLILKKFEINENVIYLRHNISIFIELANDFFDYFNKYRIFVIFEHIKSIKSIDKISFEKKEDKENIKIVSAILNIYENNQIIHKNADFEKDYIKDQERAKSIILEYLGIKNPNYYQIKSFIRILAFEFEKFNKCIGFSIESLEENFIALNKSREDAYNLRKLIVKYFINVTKHFTSGPFEELIKTQESARLILKAKNIDKDFIVQMEKRIEGITYKDIKPSLVVFNLDGGSVTILTTLSQKDNEYKNLETLYNSQDSDYLKDPQKVSKFKNLPSLSGSNILRILKNFLNINLSDEEIKNIVGNYVYTADNLIKVILIILRIKAKVPVIMMGETGCGKTRLIEMAYKLINKNKFASIRKLDIHAGTNDEDIINFIETTLEEVKKEDDNLYAMELSDKDNIKTKSEIKNEIYNREIWIFFDEINTCNSMGLLSEILCKNSYRGTPIDERFVFIAACNPYRLSEKRKMDEILLHKEQNKNMLVYSVNPLPHSLLNFVLYFGSLKEDDEKEYIKSMVKSTMESYHDYYKNNKKEFDILINMQTECIYIAQNYLKKNNDVSIVSLREVNRFLELFKFFEKYIRERNQKDPYFNSDDFRILSDSIDIDTFYKNKNNFFIHKAAVNLSLFLCYYLRLPDKKARKGLEKQLEKTKFFDKSFIEIPNLEMNYIIDNFIIPKGIAKNRALKENLFSAFICIVNKIPLIICGKPGRSKTLCIKILENSMKGKGGSKSYLCKSFPELIIHRIQGALNTKTEEVRKVFEETRNEQKKEKEIIEHLHLVLMDEMGLAELSPNNPLKITHFELEKEDNEKVPFIGITNWALDASKMNRVIYIVVQDPDEEDLISTAKEIVQSYDKPFGNYKSKYGKIFKNLSKAYFRFITDKKQKNDENKYFHGSRDFYSIIKNVISDIIKNEEKLENIGKVNEFDTLLEICMKNIERNFDGLENSILQFKEIFITLFNDITNFQLNPKDNLLEYLKENLYDTESRYLMLISDSSISEDILKYMIEEINTQVMEEKKNQEENLNLRKKEVKLFLGSKFKSDKNSIYYCDDILYKIKCQMETENIIILKDLEIVYPSLYELFNQSYTYLLNIKFTRLGKSKSLSMVNDKFKVIVLVDKENIPKEDPPFINRFEKHIVSFNNILSDNLIDISKEIEIIIEDLKSYIFQINEYQKNLTQELKYNQLNSNIKFINKEEIRGLVYIASKQGIKEKDDIIKFVFSKIVPSFTEDMMIILQKFGFKAKYDYYFGDILDIYKSNYQYNLSKYLQTCSNNLSIIYTFSFINDLLFENPNEQIHNNYFNENISNETVKEILISEINTIKKLDRQIINFITDTKSNLCIVKFRENDLIKLRDVYNLINGYASKNFDIDFNEDKKTKKICIILIHVARIGKKYQAIKNADSNNEFSNKYYISFLSETPQYFIDNINNKNDIFINILSQPPEETISYLIKKNNIIKNQIMNVLIYFKFLVRNIKIINNNNSIKNTEDDFIKFYKDKIVDKICNNEKLEDLILKSSINFFKKGEDIFIRIFKENKLKKKDCDFIEGLYHFLEKNIQNYLIKILYLFENEQIIVSFICNNNIEKSKLIMDKLDNYVDNINNVNIDKINFDNINLNNKIQTYILYGIKIPFIQKDIINEIFKFIKNEISKQYMQNEKNLMKLDVEKMDFQIKNYLETTNNINIKLKNELINYQFISSILENGEEQLIKDLFNDCFHSFLMESKIFFNDYDSLIELLDIIIQLRFKPFLGNNIEINYYSNEINDKIELSKSFLDIFKVKEENNINEIILEQNQKQVSYTEIFINVMNFIESYYKEIFSILNIYEYLNKITNKNNIQKIKSRIINKKLYFDEENSKSKINTICFYFVVESLLLEIIKFLKNKNFFEINSLFKNIKFLIMKWFKMDKSLSLSSKELFTFELLINIFEYYDKQIQQKKEEDIHKDDYGEVIKLIIEGDELFLSKKYTDLIQNLKEIDKHLKIIFDEYSNEYSELMILLATNRFELIHNDENRKNIVQLLVPDNENLVNEHLLEKSYPLIRKILGKSEPEILEENKDAAKKFLYFTQDKNNSNYYLKKILNKDYPSLNKVIIYFYENTCQNYFNKLFEIYKGSPKEYIQNSLGKISKIYLKEAINYIEDYKNKLDCLNILGKNFSIAYIKRYLELYMKELMSINSNIQYLDNKKDIDKILFSHDTIIAKEIKYYTIKLCMLLDKKNENYETLVKYFKDELNISKKDEYFRDIKLNDNKIFFYSMIPLINSNNTSFIFFKKDEKLTNFQKYKSFYEDIIKQENINEVKIPRELSDYKNYDLYYTYIYFCLCNSILNKEKKIDWYYTKEKFYELFKTQFSPDSEEDKFIKLIFNDTFMTHILPKMGINEKDLGHKEFPLIEILFYAFRFIFGILCEKNTNNFYYSLLTNKALETLENNMIPGKLANNNKLIENYQIIKQNFSKNPNYGAYLCSCGYHYEITLCSFPTRESTCPDCGKIIGGKNHILHRREGHKRVFFNEDFKNEYLKMNYADKNISFILLKDLEKQVNNKKNELFKGLKKESKDYFLARRSKVREKSYITFRILNFILHGFIFYSYLQGYLTEQYLQENLIESMTCFEIMKADWDIINNELKINQVNNIQAFFNIIFDKILISMKNQKYFPDYNKLDKFEKEIENIIQSGLKNNELLNEYINDNIIMTDNVELSDKLIILEEDIYNSNINNKYSDMQYFRKTKLPDEKDFISQFKSLEENKDYYPIINYLIDKDYNSNINYLKYLPIINQVSNEVINYCSYKLSRDEAKKTIINKDKKIIDENKVDEFIKVYKKLRSTVEQYDCFEFADKKGNMFFKDLEDEKYLYLSNFCADIGEFNYGMVITSIYLKMISWQNQFINVVLSSKNISDKNYSGLFDNEIMIQDCNENDIIKLPSIDSIMNEIIIKNSYQKNFGIIKYNYDFIEEELASKILPQIKKFVSNNENCLRYVIYQFEGFRGNKSNIITKFLEKYKPNKLSKEELQIIYEYNLTINEPNNNNNKLVKILFSLQVLINFILENNNNKDELILNIILQNEKNENIALLKDLFNKDKIRENKLFKVDSLMNVFNIFEMLCWDKIKENLLIDYKMEINDNIKNKFDLFYKDNEDKRYITRIKLATALRRFISRYLSGKRNQNEFNENNNLFFYLSKYELWDEYQFTESKEFNDELNELFSDEKNNCLIMVGHAMAIYEYIGGDISLLKDYFDSLGLNNLKEKAKNKRKKEDDEKGENKNGISLDNNYNDDNNFENNKENNNINDNYNNNKENEEISEIESNKNINNIIKENKNIQNEEEKEEEKQEKQEENKMEEEEEIDFEEDEKEDPEDEDIED